MGPRGPIRYRRWCQGHGSTVLLLPGEHVNPSVLVIAEELTFLLNCYSSLHQDARIGRVETITGQAEANRLLETFRPDVVVIDSSAAGGTGLAGLLEGFKLPYNVRMVVTCQAS